MQPPYAPLDSSTDPPMDPSLLPTWVFVAGRLAAKLARRIWRLFSSLYNPALDVLALFVLYLGFCICFLCALGLLFIFPILIPFFVIFAFFAIFTADFVWGAGYKRVVEKATYVVTVPVFFFSHATRYVVRIVGWIVVVTAALNDFNQFVEDGFFEVLWEWFVRGGWAVLGAIVLVCSLCDLLRSNGLPTQAEGKRRRREARRTARALAQY